MKKLLLATAAFASIMWVGVGVALAQSEYTKMPAGIYALDKSHASLTWKVSHMGLSNYTARFTDFDAALTFNPKHPEQSKLLVTIDPTSVKTDFPDVQKMDFDKELSTGEGWFNAGNFPQIKFVSASIERKEGNTGIMHGNLTFLGVTKPVALNVRFNAAMLEHPMNQKPTLGFSATGKIKRSDFGMETYLPNIGDNVTLLIEAEFAMEK